MMAPSYQLQVMECGVIVCYMHSDVCIDFIIYDLRNNVCFNWIKAYVIDYNSLLHLTKLNV